MEMYQNVGLSVDTQNLILKTRTIQENVQQRSTPESETIEDEIEVLEVVEERIDEEMYLDMNKSSKHVNENNEYDPDDADESMGEIQISSLIHR